MEIAGAQGRAVFFVLGALLLLAVPGVARAETTGSSLTGTSSPIGCSEDQTCILSQDELDGDVFNNVIGEPGTITGFSFRHVTGDVAFVVLRETGAGGYTVVDSTNTLTGSGVDEEESYTINGPGIPVRRGDFIGMALDSGTTVGARTAAAGESTNILELTAASPPVLVAQDRAAELFVQADWEPTPAPDPDFGGDTGGGEDDTFTAIPDPLAALKAGAKPKVQVSGKATRASKRYSVAVTVRNPNGYRVKGRLTLKAKGTKLGSKAFSIGPESSKSVTVKLSRSARARLARRRTMKATASATFKGPIGKAGSARKRITIKAPKRPRKRRAPSGGGGGGLFRPPLCVPHIQYDADGWAHAIPC